MSESKLSTEVPLKAKNNQVNGVEDEKSRGGDPRSDESSKYHIQNTQVQNILKPNGNPRTESSKNEALNKTLGVEENFKQANMFNIQSAMAAQDAFLRSGYDAALQAYCGWLPAISPMRFPAFFYPSPFIGFPPNVALTQNNPSNDLSGEAQLQDGLYYGESKASELTHKNNNNYNDDGSESRSPSEGLADSFEKQHNSGLHNEVVSDVDEGMVLEENDSEASDGLLKRRPGEQNWGNQRVATVSVIQEHCSNKNTIGNPTDDTDSEGQGDKNDPNMKRGRASTRQIEKTEQYWDRRKKNNVSAKKSRDARRQREIMTNQRSAMLETENLRLRAEVATLREDNERLKKQLSNVQSS